MAVATWASATKHSPARMRCESTEESDTTLLQLHCVSLFISTAGFL